MIEVLRKLVKVIIHTHIKTMVEFHAILHELRTSRGTGTYFMEINIAQ